eukprot:c212_g1_i1 orf=499-1320(-)
MAASCVSISFLPSALSHCSLPCSSPSSSCIPPLPFLVSSRLCLSSTFPSLIHHPASHVSVAVSLSGVGYFDEEEEESEEQIQAAYEELYGPLLGRSESKLDSGGDGWVRSRASKIPMEERVVQIKRVTKVVKGGRNMSFRAITVVGDKRGKVGVGVGSAKVVIGAVQKAVADARRHLVTVPLTKYRTFPHRAEGKYGAAKVILRPAATGTGVIAGGSVRVVMELAGVENGLGKEIRSNNPLNNARAAIVAISQMKQLTDVARDRGIPLEELWK